MEGRSDNGGYLSSGSSSTTTLSKNVFVLVQRHPIALCHERKYIGIESHVILVLPCPISVSFPFPVQTPHPKHFPIVRWVFVLDRRTGYPVATRPSDSVQHENEPQRSLFRALIMAFRMAVRAVVVHRKHWC